MQLGEFLQKVIEWLYEFWPVRVVNDWEQGIRLRGGRVVKLLTSRNGFFGSGLHAFWPLLGEIMTDNAVVDVNETAMQTNTTKDGQTVSFSLGLKYAINDLQKLYLQIQDHHETILTEAQGCAGQWVPSLDLEELDKHLANSIFKDLDERLEEWGVDLKDVTVINLTTARTFRLIGDS